jgi:hypothetical protein
MFMSGDYGVNILCKSISYIRLLAHVTIVKQLWSEGHNRPVWIGGMGASGFTWVLEHSEGTIVFFFVSDWLKGRICARGLLFCTQSGSVLFQSLKIKLFLLLFNNVDVSRQISVCNSLIGYASLCVCVRVCVWTEAAVHLIIARSIVFTA